jgi:regulator of sirC expression with transglutaminase-like and TPR domain
MDGVPAAAGGTRERLRALLERPEPFDLVEAALVVALAEYPDLELEKERARLDRLGRQATRRAEGLDNPFERLHAVQAYLFDELRFRGNTRRYEDPANSYLNVVLRRRLGTPLTLSLVFMEVAQAAGFETRGVALPGHFIAAATFGGRCLLVDPFHGGRVVTEEDCGELVARATGRPGLFHRGLLQGAPPRAVLRRLLLNLKRAWLGRSDWPRALGVVEMLLLLDPEDLFEVRDRGFLLAHLGRPGAAATDLEAYLAGLPEAPDGDAVRGKLARLRRGVIGIKGSVDA